MENNEQIDVVESSNIRMFYWGEIVCFVLSILQLILMAGFFGTSINLDYYLIAFLIPNFFIISYTGIVKGGFIPKFIEIRKDYDRFTTWRYFWQVILVTLLISIGVMILFLFLGRIIFPILAMGLKVKATGTIIQLFFILMLGVIFANISTVIRQVFYTYSRYTYPVIAKILQVSVLIIFLLAYSDELGVYSLAYGFAAGFLVELIYLIVPLRDHFEFIKDVFGLFKSKAVKETLKKSLPYLLTAAFLYLQIVEDRVIAGFGQYTGTISALNYAFTLAFKIGMIFIVPTTWFFYPRILKNINKHDLETSKKNILKTLSLLLFFSIPVFLVLMFTSGEITRVFLYRGEFNEISLRLTQWALVGYSFSIPLFGINSFLIMIFYGFKDVDFLIKPFVGTLVTNFILDIILFSIFGIFGIAFATAIVQFIIMTKLMKGLGTRLNIRIRVREIFDFKKILLISFITAVISIILIPMTNDIISTTGNDYSMRLVFILFECFAVYYFLALVFKVKALTFYSETRPEEIEE